MYYHFKKLQAANPCTEMTGFTRMLNSVGAKPDGLMDEIPTVLVNALEQGSGCRAGTENTCDMGFPVMNRPHGVTQFLEQLPESLTEQYVLIAETDHVFLKEPRNRATPTKPACFPFGYMDAKAAALRPIVQRFVDDPDVVDPCGPSPSNPNPNPNPTPYPYPQPYPSPRSGAAPRLCSSIWRSCGSSPPSGLSSPSTSSAMPRPIGCRSPR